MVGAFDTPVHPAGTFQPKHLLVLMAGNLGTGFTGRDMMRTDVVNAVLEKRVRSDSPD